MMLYDCQCRRAGKTRKRNRTLRRVQRARREKGVRADRRTRPCCCPSVPFPASPGAMSFPLDRHLPLRRLASAPTRRPSGRPRPPARPADRRPSPPAQPPTIATAVVPPAASMATRLPAADPRLSDSSSADADSTSSALTPASSDPPSSTAFPSSRRRAAPTPTPMPAAGASVPAYLDDASEEDVFNTRKKRARRGSQDVRPCSAVFLASRLPPLMGVVAARVVDRTTIQPIAPASQDAFLPESVGLSTSSKVKAAKAKRACPSPSVYSPRPPRLVIHPSILSMV